MSKPQGYLNRVAVNPATGIGVSTLVSGHTANNAVFLCPKKHGMSFMGGLCGAAKAAPLLTNGTPTRTVPSTLIGVRMADIIPIVRVHIMPNPELKPPVANLCDRDSKTIIRALKILEDHFIREDAPAFTDPEAAAIYARLRLGRMDHEEFHAFWLDNQNRVIASEMLFSGTIDSAAVYPREIVKTALARNASAVLFAHNHTSGDCTPSKQDIQITKKLKQILGLINVRVIDHLVVSSINFSSIAAMGDLDD